MEWEKVSLVVPEESDAVIWYEWVNNIETQFFLWSMYGEILTVEDEKEYFHMVRKDKTMRLFSLYANETKKVIGNISLINLDFQNRSMKNERSWLQEMKILWLYYDGILC